MLLSNRLTKQAPFCPCAGKKNGDCNCLDYAIAATNLGLSLATLSRRPLFLHSQTMSPRASTDCLLCDVEINTEYTRSSHPDCFDGCPERIRQIEKSLLRKLDLRVSFLVLVWLMNIVSFLNALMRGNFLIILQIDRGTIAWV